MSILESRSTRTLADRLQSFTRKKDAEAWEREQTHLHDTGRPLSPKRKFTLAELVTRFKASRQGGNPHTINTDDNNLAALPPALLARSLAMIQASDIRAHLVSELELGKAPSTVARAKTTLSALFPCATCRRSRSCRLRSRRSARAISQHQSSSPRGSQHFASRRHRRRLRRSSHSRACGEVSCEQPELPG